MTPKPKNQPKPVNIPQTSPRDLGVETRIGEEGVEEEEREYRNKDRNMTKEIKGMMHLSYKEVTPLENSINLDIDLKISQNLTKVLIKETDLSPEKNLWRNLISSYS